jgi:ribosomal protein S27AE
MTTGTETPTLLRAAAPVNKPVSNPYSARRLRMPCPRCIGGNMFLDHDGEYICIQCGNSMNENAKAKL